MEKLVRIVSKFIIVVVLFHVIYFIEFVNRNSHDEHRSRINIDHCAKSPCHNGGECVGLRTTYYCRCKSPYSGITCDKRIDNTEDLQ
jgi:hypothetical protein